MFSFEIIKELFYNAVVKHLQKIIFSSVLLCLCLNAHTACAQDVKRVPIEGTTISSMANIDLNDMKQRIEKLEKQLIAKYGDKQTERIQRGLRQAADMWLPEDGTPEDFENFVQTYFAGTDEEKDILFKKFEKQLEQLIGHNLMVQLSLREQVDLDLGPVQPVDQIFAGFDPGAHLHDDFFQNKLAHIILLNFPVTTLEERIQQGSQWTRRQWAEARLASMFSKRVPASVTQKIAQSFADADAYIGDYKFYMHHVLDENGDRLFNSGLKLLSHWDLRDEIRGLYSNNTDDPKRVLKKQRMLQKIMEKVIEQTVPASVINNPNLDWNLFSNEVSVSPVKDENRSDKADVKPDSTPEPDTRYATLLNIFRACKLEDPYSQKNPTLIDRRFNEDREIPEDRFSLILVEVLTAPEIKEVAALISKRLGRPLEPFDLWYTGFQARGDYSEEYLDKLCTEKYPTLKSFQDDIPNLLMKLGFTEEKAKYIGNQISVDPVRGSGHAFGAGMRFEKAHLRTEELKGGMNYKSFNTGMHELGHCTEQTISLHWIDEYFLNGVPNTAFTEGMAFFFQGKDMEMLGLQKPDEKTRALRALNDLWGCYEISAVAMVDIAVWHWMYDHPEATPAQLKAAVIDIAGKCWNTYCAPVFGLQDSPILAIYSHMIHSGLYLPDYPLGHIIEAQIQYHIEDIAAEGKKSVADEIERMDKLGCIGPDLWMQQATGSPVSARPMIHAAAEALKIIKE